MKMSKLKLNLDKVHGTEKECTGLVFNSSNKNLNSERAGYTRTGQKADNLYATLAESNYTFRPKNDKCEK